MLSRMFGNHRQEDDSLFDMKFVMPAEDEPHEGTWLQWPHNHGSAAYDRNRQRLERYEESWIQMTLALHVGEMVHIIVYDQAALNHVKSQLTQRNNCNMTNIDFHVWPTNDVWIRDNGPVFVLEQKRDKEDTCVVTDWGFNGWGNKSDYEKDNEIPRQVARALGFQHLTVPMINEGGSIEVHGETIVYTKQESKSRMEPSGCRALLFKIFGRDQLYLA
jgi:agmatine deiminase